MTACHREASREQMKELAEAMMIRIAKRPRYALS
jgi:hypothetical protein